MDSRFSWVPVYREIANKLMGWENCQADLVDFLEALRAKGLVITPLTDMDENGSHMPLREIDPFTFFGVFNRKIKDSTRIAIIGEVLKFFGLDLPPPKDFAGVPILMALKSWFFDYKPERDPQDISRLWAVFREAQKPEPFEDKGFLNAFDQAMTVRQTNLNLTMGLFWIRPDVFLNLDGTNREFLDLTLPTHGLTSSHYRGIVQLTKAKWPSFLELSAKAYDQMVEGGEPHPVEPPMGKDNAYWMLGAYWSDREPQDQTARFLESGIWQNGWNDKFIDEVKSIKVGDRVAIKAANTQKNDLPFDANGRTVSKMSLKAIGTVVANRGDGRTIEVDWDPAFKPKEWYFYTGRNTAWRLNPENEYAKKLIDFAFRNAPQDHDWFCKRWWTTEGDELLDPDPPKKPDITNPYSIEDLFRADIFIPPEDIRTALSRLQAKKNLILQGPPGVGKTFVAREFAYAVMEEKDNGRVEMVQFHQSYSYDDFIRGYRPSPDAPGKFIIRDGVFLDHCERARSDPDRPYVFIIDEINRGNISQIFGELLMLIEGDKRGSDFTVPLVYHQPNEKPFYVPKNLYLIGLMNVADRSLAMVDYALRRRFAFMTLMPQFSGERYRKWLVDRGMETSLVELIVSRMVELNGEIADDNLLGENYQIGHSYFCPKGNSFQQLGREWFEEIVKTEIVPLIHEYWYDNRDRVQQVVKKLLAK